MEFNSYEFASAQKAEGKWLLAKILLILFYAGFVGGVLYLLASLALIPVGALIPVVLWIIIHFTYRYTSPDYKYVIERGEMNFFKKYGKKEHLSLTVKFKDVLLIAPVSECEDKIKEYNVKKVYSAVPYKGARDIYALVFSEGNTSSVFYFKATRDALRAIKIYRSDVVITETEI